MPGLGVPAAALAQLALVHAVSWAQAGSTRPERPLEALEKRVLALEESLAKVRKTSGTAEQAPGFLTAAGLKFELGGKAELLLTDTDAAREPLLGAADNASSRLQVERLRLEPRVDVGRGMTLRAQVDLKPESGDSILKELAFHHDADLAEWLELELRIGLQDRFFRPTRTTKSYPLPGNAFWRDESVGVIQRVALGQRSAPESATGWSPGQLAINFSIGNGTTLGSKELGFDGAPFNDIIQDDRNLTDDLALRELGIGVDYQREGDAPGDFEARVFYVNDRLAEASRDFLRENLTIRDLVTGEPIAGYGDAPSRRAERFGASVQLFVPASKLWGSSANQRRKDGLLLIGEWIRGWDGRVTRTGWQVEASCRWSFPRRLLFDHYLRSVRPLVRYSELLLNLPAHPLLPGTWDRRQVLLGMAFEVTSNVHVEAEYRFELERTGGRSHGAPRSVDNNELVLDLIIGF